MATMTNTSKLEIQDSHGKITFLLIAGLLFLRLPFLAGITYFLKTRPNWLWPAFEISTYVLTAVLIWWENYSRFHLPAWVCSRHGRAALSRIPVGSFAPSGMERRVDMAIPGGVILLGSHLLLV
jgi:hypothetical protein